MLFSMFLLGCDAETVVPGGENKDKAGDTGDSGVEQIEDTDTADTALDTNETGETGEEDTSDEPEGEPLTWIVDGDWTDTRFGLVNLEVGEAGYTMGTVEYTANAGNEITLELPAPRDPLLVEFPDVPDLWVAFFAAGLFQDDGDEAWDSDEGWIGVAPEWAIFLEGVLPPQFAAIGLREGWNVLNLQVEPVVAGDLSAIPLTVAYRNELTLGGTADETLTEAEMAAVLPLAMFAGVYPSFIYLDEPLGADKTWSVTMTGRPPEDHFYDVDGDGQEEAVEIPYAYADADGSGAISGGDMGLGVGCIEGEAVVGWWIDAPADITYMSAIVNYGVKAGWNALIVDGSGASSVVEDASSSVVLSTTCTLPE